MTKKKKSAPAAAPQPIAVAEVPNAVEVTDEALATVDPKGTYQIRVRRAVNYGGTWLRPNSPRIRVNGFALLDLAADGAVRSFARVDA